MRCPKCQNIDTKVVDSRLSEDGRVVRRRRSCERCEFRFTTFEKMKISDFLVLKKDGTRQVYSREKLLRGVFIACEKRPISPAIVIEKIEELEEKWGSKGEATSQEVGKDIMNILEKMDQVAYVRFASVYQDFKDAGEFVQLLNKIDNEQNKNKSIKNNNSLF